MRSSTAPARGLPDPVAVAVALSETLGVLLALSRPGLAFDFQLHQTLGGKADHLAKQRCTVPALVPGETVAIGAIAATAG